MLQTLGFEKHRNVGSFGAYVLACFASFASSTEFLSHGTYASCYSIELTENYRWMSARVRVLIIIKAAENKGDLRSIRPKFQRISTKFDSNGFKNGENVKEVVITNIKAEIQDRIVHSAMKTG